MVLLGSAFSIGVFITRQLKIYLGISSLCAASLKHSTAALLEKPALRALIRKGSQLIAQLNSAALQSAIPRVSNSIMYLSKFTFALLSTKGSKAYL